MPATRASMGSARKARKVATLRDLYGECCWLCGAPMDFDAPRQSSLAPTLDHVVPLSQGGTHHNRNLRLAHSQCNNQRGDTPWVIA